MMNLWIFNLIKLSMNIQYWYEYEIRKYCNYMLLKRMSLSEMENPLKYQHSEVIRRVVLLKLCSATHYELISHFLCVETCFFTFFVCRNMFLHILCVSRVDITFFMCRDMFLHIFCVSWHVSLQFLCVASRYHIFFVSKHVFPHF
jgi:hypothetical protein